jgi:hypothetical protein
MGKPIVYCDSCGERLRDEDFGRGRAFTLENRNFCANCRPEGAQPAPPRPASSSQRIPVSNLTPRRAMSALPARPPPRSAVPWVVGGSVLGALILLVAVASSGGPPEPAPAPKAPPAPRPVAVVRPPAPPPPAPEAGDDLRRQAQLDRFVADVRGQIREAQDIEAKRSEIEGRIRAAEAAGGTRPEFAELRAELEAAVGKAKQPPGLVGHWTLDEVQAGKVADASTNGFAGAVKGKAAPVAGRIGGALEFDGSGGHVELPKTDALNQLQKGSYTLALWYKPAEAPSGANGKDNAWAHGLLVKAGMHTGLEYVTGTRFVIDHWLASGGHAFASGNLVCPPGRWMHVAGVIDREAGEVRLYVDGKRDTSKSYTKGAEGREYGTGPWRIGIALPNGKEYRYAAKGAFDDVKIFSRALSVDEIQALFSAAK